MSGIVCTGYEDASRESQAGRAGSGIVHTVYERYEQRESSWQGRRRADSRQAGGTKDQRQKVNNINTNGKKERTRYIYEYALHERVRIPENIRTIRPN